MIDWADNIAADYHAAALRLATLTEGGVQHLLFASIELYPHEIVPPPPVVERAKDGTNTSLSFKRSKLH
jgi:hypothetical protein